MSTIYGLLLESHDKRELRLALIKAENLDEALFQTLQGVTREMQQLNTPDKMPFVNKYVSSLRLVKHATIDGGDTAIVSSPPATITIDTKVVEENKEKSKSAILEILSLVRDRYAETKQETMVLERLIKRINRLI